MRLAVYIALLFIFPLLAQQEEATGRIEGLVLVEGESKEVELDAGVHIWLEKGDFETLKSRLEAFIKHPLNETLLSQVKAVIIDYFRKEKNEYVAVTIPEQQVENGVVVMEVFVGRVGRVEYKGQKWFGAGALKRALRVKPGDCIVERDLLNYVAWINRNPFHHMQMILEPGTEVGSTNLEFYSQDRFPARFFAGADNTGFKPNGEVRLYGGFTWGNAFFLGDLLSYQYIASPNFHRFQSHVYSYTSFLSWKHLLTVFGCYGQIFPNISNFSNEGKNIQASGRYSIPFKPLYGDFRHSLDLGFDWKYLTSNLFFTGNTQEVVTVSQQIEEITQFLIGYNFHKNWVHHALSFSCQIYASPWKDWFPHQSDFDFESLRPGSRARYGYMRLSLGDRYRTECGWVVAGLIRGQAAANALPTSEQFGLGGADTVRGYFEQQFVADDAICVNLEIYTPPLSLFKANRNELSFLVFGDYGYGKNYRSINSEFVWQQLAGVGPGIRYDIVPYMSMKADYGFQLIGIPGDHRFGRFHLSLNVSY